MSTRRLTVASMSTTTPSAPVDGPCDDTCGCATDTALPIACTLGAGELSGRIDEWSALLDNVAAREGLPDGLRLRFRPDADVTEIARLAQAEQGCCRFFDFALLI